MLCNKYVNNKSMDGLWRYISKKQHLAETVMFPLASLAQSDMYSTGLHIRQVIMWLQVRSLPGSVTLFTGDGARSIFYGHSPPFADSRRAVVSFWGKNVYKYW